jgi:uncharacterized radical SAM superfamily protein
MSFLKIELNKMISQSIIGEFIHLMLKHCMREFIRKVLQYFRIGISQVQNDGIASIEQFENLPNKISRFWIMVFL